MSLQNLPEDFLYAALLPEAIVELDELKLIQAVVGGYQDRVDDLRSYVSKLELLMDTGGLPETDATGAPVNNAVIAQVQSPAGRIYPRSLEILTSTPADGSADLRAWALEQLQLPEGATLLGVAYGVDKLRLVDANTVQYLAATVGAVLYQTAAQDPDATRSDAQRLLDTWFPRLKIKGTAQSFESLGRMLGFDDVRMVPLWGRVSPRLPSDFGSPDNDPDFSEKPEFIPKQQRDIFYDPLVLDDGVFYTWSGTATTLNGTSSTDFYTLAINGVNPYIRVNAIGTSFSNPNSSQSPFILTGGGPQTKAFVNPSGTGLQFQALAEGESFNGLAVHVLDWNSGSHRFISITDRLSSIKYRTSCFNLGLTMEFDRAEERFGTTVAKKNKDLVVDPTSANFGTAAVSPYRPWVAGSLTLEQTTADFLVQTSSTGTVDVYTSRTQATLAHRQIDTTGLVAAGVQAVQAFEEVRAATRLPRNVREGFLMRDEVCYADYVSTGTLFTTLSGIGTYYGTMAGNPLPSFTSQFEVLNAIAAKLTWVSEASGQYIVQGSPDLFVWNDISAPITATSTSTTFTIISGATFAFFRIKRTAPTAGFVAATLELVPYSARLGEESAVGNDNFVRLASASMDVTGTFNYDDKSYKIAFPNGVDVGVDVVTHWQTTTTEVAREEPEVDPGTDVFAFVGDQGLQSVNQQNVASMIRGWNPKLVVMLGDNNYNDASPSTIYPNFAAYDYFRFRQELFAILGNHDWFPGGGSGTDPSAQTDFLFYLPGNGRYFDLVRGNVHFFFLSSGINSTDSTTPSTTNTVEPDGNSLTSIQALWLKARLAASQAPWKIVFIHHPPFTSATNVSSYYPGYSVLRWPYKEWGANLVVSGHVHAYERLSYNGLTYLTCGIGGQTNRFYSGSVSPYSVLRYRVGGSVSDYGALRIVSSATTLRVQLQTLTEGTQDDFTLEKLEADLECQDRPEDELDSPVLDLVDEYPWRRDFVGGGELVDLVTYVPPTPDISLTPVGNTVSVPDQSGAENSVNLLLSSVTPPRITSNPRSTDDYVPGQQAVAFKGSFRDLSDMSAYLSDPLVRRVKTTLGITNSVDDLDAVMTAGWQLYNFGLVQSVLVADPVKFFGTHQRNNLTGWLPFNEHPLDNLKVSDRSRFDTVQELSGVVWDDRTFDSQRGWYLHLAASGSVVTSGTDRGMTDYYSISMWIRPDALTSGTHTFFNYGPVSLDLCCDGTVNFAGVYMRATEDGMRAAVTKLSVGTEEFNFLAVAVAPGTIKSYVGDLTGIASTTTTVIATGSYTEDNTQMAVIAGTNAFGIHDLRMWSATKPDSAIGLIRYHDPVVTAARYRIAWLQVANDYDRYAFKVLDSGFISPEVLPAWLKTPRLGLVQRYDSMGAYDAQSRYKEVGLGGGRPLPETYRLGTQFTNLTAAGTVVVSTADGALPGVNAVWFNDNVAPVYLGLNESGSTSTGITATGTSTGLVSPWPNSMVATNPCRDRIWTRGDDGYVYEVTLKYVSGQIGFSAEKLVRTRSDAELKLSGTEGVNASILKELATSGSVSTVMSRGTVYPRQLLIVAGTSSTTDDGSTGIIPNGQIYAGVVVPSTGVVTVFTSGADTVKIYHPATLLYADQPTGAEVQLTGISPNGMLGVSTYGTVYQKAYSGTITSPSLFMYANEQIVIEKDGVDAFTFWDDPNSFGSSQIPPVAALTGNGEISFENTATLEVGNYRLVVESGNIGKLDDDFDGFHVFITVGDTIFEARLLRGQKGNDITGSDTFEFELENAVSGNWLLTFDWTNDFRDQRRGTERQLKIISFSLSYLTTNLYKVSVASSGTLPALMLLDTVNYASGTTAGGWYATLCSWGTVVRYVHESKVYSSNDTIMARIPHSDVLTATTMERREDIIVSSSGSGTVAECCIELEDGSGGIQMEDGSGCIEMEACPGPSSVLFVLPDEPDPVFVSFGTVIVVT